LWCFGLTDAEGLSEVCIHSIVSFALSLGRLDPGPDGAELVLLSVVLAFKLVHAVGGVHPRIALEPDDFNRDYAVSRYLLFSSSQNGVYVLVCDLTVLGGKHVTGSVADHVEHLVLPKLVSVLRIAHHPTLLDDYIVQAEFHLSPLDDALLHCVFCDEPEHTDLLLLADTMGSILKRYTIDRNIDDEDRTHNINIHLRIPVRVKQNNDICSGQIDTQATSPGAQHENELCAIGVVEPHPPNNLAPYLSLFVRRLSIKAAVVIPAPETVVLQDIKHTLHLTILLESGQQLIQDDHFAAVFNQMIISCVGSLTWLHAVKQVRVVAAFPQLHEDVEQPHLVAAASAVYYVNVFHENLRV
ncbi:hypothetical protein EGW08_000771, partial [Elysia chlorotica]